MTSPLNRLSEALKVTVDDRRFILIRGQEEAPGEVVLVQNVSEELKAKVGK